MEGELGRLTARFARDGRVEWIGLRPGRKEPVRAVEHVAVRSEGLEGDHRARPGKRAVTLIQHEHLPVIAALAARGEIDPADLRRNLVVSGISLLGLRNRVFRVGTAVLRGTGLCAPCSRMEEALGHGGYTAMRGHGGITASVEVAGLVGLGDDVVPVDPETHADNS